MVNIFIDGLVNVYRESKKHAEEGKNLRVHWIGDEIFEVSSSLWKEARDLHKELLELCANDQSQENIITDPIEDFAKLVRELRTEYPTKIVFLDKKMRPLSYLFPNANGPVLHYSRVRDLTTDSWAPAYLLRPQELKYAKLWARGITPHDVLLILDDVSFSGSTALESQRDLGISNDVLKIFGFLMASSVANERLGSNSVIHTSRTLDFNGNPRDDAWHGSDYCFPLTGHNDVRISLDKLRETVEQQLEGKASNLDVIAKLKLPRYMANPPLWVSRYFQQHLNPEKLYNNLEKIFGPNGILERFAALASKSLDREYTMSEIMEGVVKGRYTSVTDVMRRYHR